MGSSESSSKIDYQSYMNNFQFSISDLNEKIENIFIISVPLKGSNWQTTGKMVLKLSLIGAPLADLIPEIEHQGVIFKTESDKYFYAQFPSHNGKLIKTSKLEAIEAIIDGCEHEKCRQWFVKEKFAIKKGGEVTIKNIYDIIRSLKFEYYNIITKNCQMYVDKIIRKLPSIHRVGYNGEKNIDYINLGRGGDLSF